jgi:hypothetical protein
MIFFHWARSAEDAIHHAAVGAKMRSARIGTIMGAFGWVRQRRVPIWRVRAALTELLIHVWKLSK